MTVSDLEYLKASVGRIVEVEIRTGEHLVIKVISVFDQESEPDVFYWDVSSNPRMHDSEHSKGFSLPLKEIASVKRPELEGGRP